MKRSQQVRAPRFRKSLPGATCLALSVALALQGCSPNQYEEEAQIYRNADECIQVYPDQPELCEQVFGSAQMDHLATAPRFSNQMQCEEEFGMGACESAPEGAQGNDQGGSWFMPMMMGYMMGNMLSGNRVRQTPVYTSSSRSSKLNGKLVTGQGTVVGNRGDRVVRTSPSAFQKSAPTRIKSTGGFGKMAAQKSQTSRTSTKTRSFGG